MAGTQVFPTPPSSGGGSSALTWPGWFGDAADGDFTVTTTNFAPGRERNYGNLTVNSGASVVPTGFRIFVNGLLRNQGTISDNGNNADLSTGGANLAATQYLRNASGSGPNGGSTTANGNPGNTSSNSSFNNAGLTPNGGAGGNAGVQTGGAGGVAGTVTTRWAGQLIQARHQTAAFGGGAGGGSGAVVTGGAGANGGGGGGGGGVVWIAARTVTTRAASSPHEAAMAATGPASALASQAVVAVVAAVWSVSCRPRPPRRWAAPSRRQAARAARALTVAARVSPGPPAPSTTLFSGEP